MLLLYSDGILERPGRAMPGSTEELAQVAADSAAGRALRDPGATPAERVCTQTVELLVRASGHAVARPLATDREFRISDGPGSDESLVLVEGPLDADTAERLRQNLLYRGRGGTLPLTVDLAEVTHLASAGVSALHRVAEKHGQQGGKLTLLAAAGSPAQLILALVAIPNVTLGLL
jgi:anti-anti-sigma regulatory factor